EGKYTWSEQELLEVSIVPVPANPRALGKKELAIFKSLEEKMGETLLEEQKDEEAGDEPEPEGDEPNEPEAETTPEDETTDKAQPVTSENLVEIVSKAVADGIALYRKQEADEKEQVESQAASKQKEAL